MTAENDVYAAVHALREEVRRLGHWVLELSEAGMEGQQRTPWGDYDREFDARVPALTPPVEDMTCEEALSEALAQIVVLRRKLVAGR